MTTPQHRSTITLITGGNKGLGFETALQLGLTHRHTVLIGARDRQRGEEAVEKLKHRGIDAHWISLEVTDSDSIAAAAREVEQKFGRLDVLVNNAGYFATEGDHIASEAKMEALRRTFDINFFGLIAVTNAFLPLIRKSAHGRIVNLSSILGSIAEHADPNSPIYNMKVVAYDASKAAVNMFTVHLAHELRGTPIKVNAAHPGWVKTDMGGPNAPLDVSEGVETSVALATLPPDAPGAPAAPSGGFFHKGVHMRW